ncbi:class I glutamine amidotransferase-like protein [Parathielavia appendiculata]|uniref:Class I glutamine amidotransferase-like protein n=1 Tax=Parathielavia appendiculata TaxID=2587402 RepID=A0AAN6TXH6_9PEZI|nr:class I glutamine amidotransferase-like protein [Parathielavia appendiculata]
MLPVLSNPGLLITSLTVVMSLISPAAGASVHSRTEDKSCGSGMYKSPPRHFGFLLPRAFSVLDVFGPLEVFQALARQTKLDLSMLSRTMDPAKTETIHAAMNRFNSSFFPQVVVTHTYADKPPIDVLVVPGGAAARSPDLGPELEYIRKAFPKLKYLITICTGAGIAAQSGVMDGYRATTNKQAWKQMTAMGPKVKWVSPARWVEDGKVWSSSGVTAGIDLALEFIRQKYENGTAIAEAISGAIEHTPILDWREDPWAAKFNVTPQN